MEMYVTNGRTQCCHLDGTDFYFGANTFAAIPSDECICLAQITKAIGVGCWWRGARTLVIADTE